MKFACQQYYRRILLVVTSLTCTLLFPGCYIVKQGAAVVQFQLQAKPIAKILAKNNASDSMNTFCLLVQQVNAFARDSLGLKKNNNFTNYIEIKKPYLLDMVCASRPLEFKPYQWSYPLFGSWPLRSYFDKKDAEKEAERLRNTGYEVYIGKSGAFSLLGFMSDPIYSFMKRYSVYHIANLILHEQTHAAIYLKNQVQFNEEVATFIGTEGALCFIMSHYGDTSQLYKKALQEAHDDIAYYAIMKVLYDKLSAVYSSKDPDSMKLVAKKITIEQFYDSLETNYTAIFETELYRGLGKRPANNAILAVDMIYGRDLSLYYYLYEKNNKNIAKTCSAIVSLKKNKGDAKEALKSILSQLPD